MQYKKIQFSLILGVLFLVCLHQSTPNYINYQKDAQQFDKNIKAAYTWDSPIDYTYYRGETPSYTITWTISNPSEQFVSLTIYKALYDDYNWNAFENEYIGAAYAVSNVASYSGFDAIIELSYIVQNNGVNTSYFFSEGSSTPIDLVKARILDHPPTLSRNPSNTTLELYLEDGTASIMLELYITDTMSGTTTTYNITDSSDIIITSGTWSSPFNMLLGLDFHFIGTYEYNFNVADVGSGWAYYITMPITISILSTPPPDDDNDDGSEELIFYDEDQLNETVIISKTTTYILIALGSGGIVFSIYYLYMRSICGTSPNWTCKEKKKITRLPKNPLS